MDDNYIPEDGNFEIQTDGEVNLDELVNPDPLKTAERKVRGALMSNKNNDHQGVLRYTLASHNNNEYRQELKMLNFANSDEADEFVSAIAECKALGMDTTPIIDQALARSAGVKHEFIHRAFDALTHQTHSIYTNYNKKAPGSNDTKTVSPF